MPPYLVEANMDRPPPVGMQLYTIKETCDILRFSKSTIHKLMRKGILDRIKLGRCTRITGESIHRYWTSPPSC